MSQRTPTKLECTKYAEAYITNSQNETQAFKVTFPKSKALPDTLNNSASRFHKLPQVRTRIKELRDKANKEADDKALYTVNDKKRWLIDLVHYGKEEEVIPMPQWKKDAGHEEELRQRHPASAVAAIKELNLMDGDHAAKEFKVEQTSLTAFGERLG